MDSRLIYTTANAAIKSIEWTKITLDTEWIHFVENDIINKNLIAAIINNQISDDFVYIITSRKESVKINKIDLEHSLINLLLNQNFSIWNLAFNKVIEFNKIGVLRYGQKTTP